MILYGLFSCNLILTVSVIRTQCSIIKKKTVINVELCPCWKKSFFDTYLVLTIFSAEKIDNGPITIFTQSMAGFYIIPRNIYTNVVQNSADSGL